MQRTRTTFQQVRKCERAILKKKNMTNSTDAQLSKTMDKIKEELHEIIFMYKANRHKHSNILDQMENDVLQKKTLSQKP